ncbi:EAL domain-containing protein [Chitinibacter bivalviorum]|uniref:EAL domain-containing protein n=1 Tax=Chitinibacter bivalviorum TaxID=2739434 RepID=A0A7H9BGL0_9NEIS|nr:EAL domain-containing protein [Chitinibacter bivalviorum]QLG87860.1 EAL domain-containing protein [Chitinibacter bivalviorum]
MAVFATGLVVTVTMTLFLLKLEYDRSLQQTRSDLQTLGKTATPQLASNLWLVNTESIHSQLNSLLQTRVVQHALLVESDGQQYASGQELNIGHDVVTESFPVVYLHPLTNKEVVLGELKLSTTLSELESRLYAQFLRLLLLEGLGMATAALFFLILYHRLIARHLSHIAEYTRHFNYGLLSSPLHLQRTVDKPDEMQTLVDAINEMRGNLQRGYREREETQRALYVEKELAEVTLISITDAILTTDHDFKIKLINPAAEQLTGWSTQDARGRFVADLLCLGGDLTPDELYQVLGRARDDLKAQNAQKAMLLNRDGAKLNVEYAAAPITDQDGQVVGLVLVLHDVTEAQALTEKLAYQADHDYLTGLTNRRGFENALVIAHQQVLLDHQPHILMLLDLDQFKLVNDTCGHLAGDELLRHVTTLLQGLMLPGRSILGRLGGDEFGVLLSNTTHAEAQVLAERMLHALAQFRFVWQDRPHGVTVSIGLVKLDHRCASPQEAMSQADVACFAAKDAGRNQLSWYSSDDQDLLERHNEIQLLATLKEAIEQNRFQLYFQAITPMNRIDAEIPHLEILIRLIDSNGRVITPGAFIPAAERYDMMAQIDRWVIEHSIKYLADRVHSNSPLPQLAINLSGKSLNKQTLAFILQQLDMTLVPPYAICFEITETAAISNLKESSVFIETLRTRGCKFALDDFGSGFSSFNYLKTLPVDFLKIDGSLVTDIADDKVSRQMVIAVNDIAHSLGCKTIAEFVENEAILHELAAIGVDYAQGFYFGKPAPLV